MHNYKYHFPKPAESNCQKNRSWKYASCILTNISFFETC